ncbi:alanine racemase [Alicyclobacillus acidoterrestris]|uniref:alanine racemase n=1 Tax=Alicyclobacillus suci TaxID=2816080 RepID=UPI0011979EB1|nr:alanine racemase [Alicyclobacillus suci]GEO26420.1 alanine racemase [Alicyclobacillus acidoterrestris]
MIHFTKEQHYRDTWAEVNLDAIRHNVRAVRACVGLDTLIMAVVKANAYGHGASPVAKAAIEAGANYLGVATLDEAIALRGAGIERPILVLGYVSGEYAIVAARQGIVLTVVGLQHAQELVAKFPRGQAIDLHVHLKLDTGMGRLGVRTADELAMEVEAISAHPSIYIDGAFTHFAQADSADKTYTMQQLQQANERFCALRNTLGLNNAESLILHAANSAAILQFPDSYLNMVRLGISLYGVYPSSEVNRDRITLRQALTMYTRIAYCKVVPPGTSVSYGRTFITKQTMKVATLPVGYADGYHRSLSNRGYAVVRGVKCPIVGTICMDQTMINVSQVDGVEAGEVVTIYDEQTLPELADLAQTIPYELLCSISPRVPRRYVEDD